MQILAVFQWLCLEGLLCLSNERHEVTMVTYLISCMLNLVLTCFLGKLRESHLLFSKAALVKFGGLFHRMLSTQLSPQKPV